MRRATALIVAFWLVSLSLPARAASAADPGAPGPYAVGHTGFVVVDPTRDSGTSYGGRPIYVSVFYPIDRSAITAAAPPAVYPLDPVGSHWPVSTSTQWERYGLDPAYEGLAPSADGAFPLIMFSPGWGNLYFANLFTGVRAASHGFVVALLTHYADGAAPWDPWDEIHIALVNRPRDISFALSAVLDRAATSGDILHGAVQPSAVAAAGHSLGGYAALALAGGDDTVCDRAVDPRGLPIPPSTCVASLPDPRIKATVTFDGSSQILWFQELARITTPAMVVGQAWANVGSWHAREHAAIAAEPNYRVDVKDALHPSFTGFCQSARVLRDLGVITAQQLANRLARPWCSTALPAPEVQRLATKYMIAFLKTNLVHETGYQQMLTPGWALTSESAIQFFVTERTNAHATDENLPCMVSSCPTFGYFTTQPGSTREQAERDPAAITPLIEQLDGAER